MVAIDVERHKLYPNEKDDNIEKWKNQAFIAAYGRLYMSLMSAVSLPIISFFVVCFTPFINIKLNATRTDDDWIRMGLTVLPHLILSIVLIGRTLPIYRRPLPNRQKWSSLAEDMKGKAKYAIGLFIVISILTFMDLRDLHYITEQNYDECRRSVGILVNWIVSLLLTLFTVRTNCDQTRVALSLEALDILEWTGKKHLYSECKVELTNAAQKSFITQMWKMHEFLCIGKTVAEMARVYMFLMVAGALWMIIISFFELYHNFEGSILLLILVFVLHFVLCCFAYESVNKGKFSGCISYVIFCESIWTGFGAYHLFHEPSLVEFVNRSIRYWNGSPQPLSVPGTLWAAEWIKDYPNAMAVYSLTVMFLSLHALYLIHSIHTFLCYVINHQSRPASTDLEEARENII